MHPIVALLLSTDPARVADGMLQADEAFAAGHLAADDRRAVRDALVVIAEAEPAHPSAGAAVWALGKLADPELRPMLVRFLSRAVARLESGGSDVWQAMVALADAGERSLMVSGHGRQFDENFRRATEFLRREGAA